MVRSPSSFNGTTRLIKKGIWTSDEDEILRKHINIYGHPNWRAIPRLTGLARCGKSCRLRWTNYLNPGIKRGNFTMEEEEIIITSHQLLGNRWSAIAAKLPGRTDNEIKNVWNTYIKKKYLLDKDDTQQSSASTDHSSNNMTSNEKDFIFVDESIFDMVWDDSLSNQVHNAAYADDPDHDQSVKTPNVTIARNTNVKHIVNVPYLPLQRSYSETSYNNNKDAPPLEFPETDEHFWSDVISYDHNQNNSGSSSMEHYYPYLDQQRVESSLTTVSYNNVINKETIHHQEAHVSSSPNVGSIPVSNVSENNSTAEDGGDVDDFWFDILFSAGEHPFFSL